MTQSDQGGSAAQPAPEGQQRAARAGRAGRTGRHAGGDALFDEARDRIPEPSGAKRVKVDRKTQGKGDERGGPPDPGSPDSTYNLLRQETVLMTVLGQDPDVTDGLGIIRAQIPVPADRLAAGPRNHRLHVVDIAVGALDAGPPVVLHEEDDPWTYVDPWGDTSITDDELSNDPKFRAQNLFAVASHTLALFERHLGRRIPWRSGFPHLYLVPDALLAGNARYSAEHSAVLFGHLPAVGKLPALHTSLSYDVIAHEMTHAILDGLRPRYIEPGLPDQLAFHEALADLVALLSVFGLPGVAEQVLGKDGPLPFTDGPDQLRQTEERKKFLRQTPLLGLAEQLGRRKLTRVPDGEDSTASTPAQPVATALRRSVELEPTTSWKDDPTYTSPHRRAEVLMAAVMQTLVSIWAERLDPFKVAGGMDLARVAEEGRKSAGHLLGMVLRSIDYLPPVELEFADVIDAIITADIRLMPEDDRGYRAALMASFKAFGIEPPPHKIVDEDGAAAPTRDAASKAIARRDAQRLMKYPADADGSRLGIRYEHVNLAAMRTSPEEVYQFIWSNSVALGIDVRFSTQVERVIATTRVGPDGLVVQEILAEYTQRLRTTAGHLPPGMKQPKGADPAAAVEMWGGGVLVFDQFGRFRLHQRKPLLDKVRQQARLDHLVRRDLHDADGGFGTNDGARASQRFALLHSSSEEATW